jgi:hypothetical protein
MTSSRGLRSTKLRRKSMFVARRALAKRPPSRPMEGDALSPWRTVPPSFASAVFGRQPAVPSDCVPEDVVDIPRPRCRRVALEAQGLGGACRPRPRADRDPNGHDRHVSRRLKMGLIATTRMGFTPTRRPPASPRRQRAGGVLRSALSAPRRPLSRCRACPG